MRLFETRSPGIMTETQRDQLVDQIIQTYELPQVPGLRPSLQALAQVQYAPQFRPWLWLKKSMANASERFQHWWNYSYERQDRVIMTAIISLAVAGVFWVALSMFSYAQRVEYLRTVQGHRNRTQFLYRTQDEVPLVVTLITHVKGSEIPPFAEWEESDQAKLQLMVAQEVIGDHTYQELSQKPQILDDQLMRTFARSPAFFKAGKYWTEGVTHELKPLVSDTTPQPEEKEDDPNATRKTSAG